jgi:hypothetical protein
MIHFNSFGRTTIDASVAILGKYSLPLCTRQSRVSTFQPCTSLAYVRPRHFPTFRSRTIPLHRRLVQFSGAFLRLVTISLTALITTWLTAFLPNLSATLDTILGWMLMCLFVTMALIASPTHFLSEIGFSRVHGTARNTWAWISFARLYVLSCVHSTIASGAHFTNESAARWLKRTAYNARSAILSKRYEIWAIVQSFIARKAKMTTIVFGVCLTTLNTGARISCHCPLRIMGYKPRQLYIVIRGYANG